MYIGIMEDTPVGHAVNCAAHASLMCYLKYEDLPEMQNWKNQSFRKVSCKVTREEFEKLKQFYKSAVITECALDGRPIAVAIVPVTEDSPGFGFLRSLKLWA
jgi:peptidyl-tRNA hydrolase